MDIKITEAVDLFNLLEKMNSVHIPIKTSYLLAKLKNKLKTENDFYLNQLRNYINEYGEKDEEGQLVTKDQGIAIQNDKIEECNLKVKELNSMEIHIDDIKIPLEDLSEAKLTLDEIQVLLPFISEE